MLLHISQACLDPGAKKGSKGVLMLKSGDDGPYAICSLREGGTESVNLDLLVEDYTEFSIVGNAGIHLTGYHMPQEEDGPGFEEDGDLDEEDEDDFDMAFDEDPGLLGFDEEGLPIYLEDGDESDDDDDDDDVPRNDVVIEDVTEDQEGEESESEEEEESESEEEEEEESEDEESEEEQAPRNNKNKKKEPVEVSKRKAMDVDKDSKKKAKSGEEPVEKKSKSKKYPNGFEIHEVQQGKASGKLAKAGKRVSVRYTGKLTNGKVFDQTKGKKTFQFRLGVGEVIKGWDRGVEGMRVGDKRKLVVPPQMGYGSSKVGPIPANSTLVFDVELVDVKN